MVDSDETTCQPASIEFDIIMYYDKYAITNYTLIRYIDAAGYYLLTKYKDKIKITALHLQSDKIRLLYEEVSGYGTGIS